MSEYIEREAALKILLQCADVYDTECSDITVAHAMRKINKITAADVVPVRHGRWEKKKDAINWSCSICGNEPFHCHLEHMNYCPNCGALMDKDGDGDV